MSSLAIAVSPQRRRALEGNIRSCFAIMALFGSFAFSVPTIVLLWKANGLSVADGVLLQVYFTITMLVFDVPTGYFADVVGRKAALVSSALLYILGASAYTLASSFHQFLIGEIALGVALSLASGADQALLYDTLRELGRESEFTQIWGRAKGLTFKLMAVATVLGGMMADYNIRSPLYIVCVGAVTLLLVTLSVTEASSENKAERACFAEIINLARFALLDNRRTRWLILIWAFICAALQAPFWLYQPYLELTGVKIAYLGFFWATFNLVAGASSKNAARIFGELDERIMVVWLIGLIALGYGLLGSIVVGLSGLFILLLQVVRGSFDVLLSSKLNAAIIARRATQISLQAMISRLAYLSALLPIRALVDRAGVAQSFQLISLVVAGIGLTLTFLCYETSGET